MRIIHSIFFKFQLTKLRVASIEKLFLGEINIAHVRKVLTKNEEGATHSRRYTLNKNLQNKWNAYESINDESNCNVPRAFMTVNLQFVKLG